MIKNFTKKIYLLYFVAIFFSNINLHSEVPSFECINVPTAEVADYGTGYFSFRIYSYGSMIVGFVFSPFNRINFGGSLDIKNLIDYKTPSLKDPAFYFKWRIFDGSRSLPAFALGYDGQDYNFADKYLPAKNLYFVFSQNVLYRKFFLDLGANITKYDGNQKILGFVSLRLMIEDVIDFGIEYENIGIKKIQQLNCKVGVNLGGVVSVNLIFNDLTNNDERIERQIRINYLYRFF